MKIVYEQRIEIRSIENSPLQQVVRVFTFDSGNTYEKVAHEGTPAECELVVRALVEAMGGSGRWTET